nr:LysM peptidoglycan-binding domain-containing protein [Flocculibacter collagenilyticus]
MHDNSIATTSDVINALTIDALLHDKNIEIDDAESPEAFDDLWKRIQFQLSLNVPQNRQVVTQRNWYNKHQSYLDRISKRARPFLFMIVEEIEKRNMPIELALLPIVESAFDPFAYSHGRASGMWQFVPETGKRFGLKQNWWYDGRRDAYAATIAALDYLSFLHKTLEGDWLNAIAAYNSGEGRVLRAIKRNKKRHLPTDFWSLDLPKETIAYVPKLLALADLLKRDEEFGIVWKSIPNKPYLEIIDVGSQIDLALAAEMANMEVGELYGLNSGYNQWATDPEGPHRFLLPIENAKVFKEKLPNTPAEKRLNWTRYKVKGGDSLGVIAQRFHTTPSIIRKINGIKNNIIRKGDHLLIPVAAKDLDDYSLSSQKRLASTQSKSRGSGSYKIEHAVKSGDTLWDISREYKVNLRSLAKWNGMAPTDTLSLGQKLVIWKKQDSKHQAEKAIMRTISYKVRRGDSLARIANKFNVKVNDIVKWNNINTKQYLQPGQKLKLHVNVTKA